MRILERNARSIYFKNYLGLTQIERDGMKTGEYEKTYSDLFEERMNISPASGVASLEMFGDLTNYSKVAVTCNMDCSLTENSIVWVDKTTTDSYDYIVVRVSKSLNNIAYALRKVDVLSEG